MSFHTLTEDEYNDLAFEPDHHISTRTTKNCGNLIEALFSKH